MTLRSSFSKVNNNRFVYFEFPPKINVHRLLLTGDRICEVESLSNCMLCRSRWVAGECSSPITPWSPGSWGPAGWCSYMWYTRQGPVTSPVEIDRKRHITYLILLIVHIITLNSIENDAKSPVQACNHKRFWHRRWYYLFISEYTNLFCESYSSWSVFTCSLFYLCLSCLFVVSYNKHCH